MSVLILNFTANAAPVKFNQVVQFVSVKPGNAKTGAFAQLRLANDLIVFGDDDGDGDTKKPPPQQQDDRIISETKIEVVEDEVCDCVESEVIPRRGFPKWALLGLAAIPIAFLITRDKDKTPTPTTTTTPTTTPTLPSTTTPTPTLTPTPTITPTPTPPEPVPEPMTILLFGTGLAGIGLAARRKFGQKKAEKSEE